MMTSPLYRRLLLSVLFLLCAGLTACEDAPRWIDPGTPVEHDLNEILGRDTLVVLATYNSTSYFLYRGEPMGYEYDLLKTFTDEHDLHMRTVIVSDQDSLFYLLNQGVGDVIAARLTPLSIEKTGVTFTEPLYQTRATLVQREQPLPAPNTPEVVDTLLADEPEADTLQRDRPAGATPDSVVIQARLVQRPSELAGESVHVPGTSAYYDLLVELSDELTGDIEVVEVRGDISTEKLIRKVAAGEIEFTVSPENLAKLKESYFTNIAVRPTLGPPLNVAWAVRENAPELRAALNRWIEDEENASLFSSLYEKYFIDRRGYREREESAYLTSETGRLSDYDELLQRYAPQIDWDWRLLASQTYQESKFDPDARSWAGAMGLLQLMPGTARQYGVDDPYEPEENVRGAVDFLQWLQEYWSKEIPDEQERLRFILASYNAGHGHVEDARRLTRKHGDDPNAWENVAYWLLQKSKRQYYTDPVVKYGFCRGLEPVTYVSRILERFDNYAEFVA